MKRYYFFYLFFLIIFINTIYTEEKAQELEQYIEKLTDNSPECSDKRNNSLNLCMSNAIENFITENYKISLSEYDKHYISEVCNNDSLLKTLQNLNVINGFNFAVKHFDMSKSSFSLLKFLYGAEKFPKFPVEIQNKKFISDYKFIKKRIGFTKQAMPYDIYSLLEASKSKYYKKTINLLVDNFSFTQKKLKSLKLNSDLSSKKLFRGMKELVSENGYNLLKYVSEITPNQQMITRVDDVLYEKVQGIYFEDMVLVATHGGMNYLRNKIKEKDNDLLLYGNSLSMIADSIRFTNEKKLLLENSIKHRVNKPSTNFLNKFIKNENYNPVLADQYLLSFMEKDKITQSKKELVETINSWIKDKKTFTPRNTDMDGRMESEISSLNDIDYLNLYRIKLIIEGIKNKENQNKIKEMVLKDKEDKRTEYGGIIVFLKEKPVFMQKIDFSKKTSDETYELPYYDKMPPGIATFHLHSHNLDYKSHAHPSGGDYATGVRTKKVDVVITPVGSKGSKLLINFDVYFIHPVTGKNVVLDLGTIEI